jgi:HK97 family phage prohead protease
MDSILDFKSFENSVKDVDVKRRIVTGYLSAFGNKDYDNDIIEKGAFSKTISERKDNIFFLNQHNWRQPHGKFAVLQEDEKGLYFESMPLTDTTYSDDALKLYEAGIVKEHSIGFNVVKSEHDKKSGIRTIKEIKLYEGSNVTLGANPDTPFTGFKSLTLQEVNDRAKTILKAFRNGTFTDETFVLLEFALKELQNQAYLLGTKSQVITEPLQNTQSDNTADYINEYLKSI